MKVRILGKTENPLDFIGACVGGCWGSPVDNGEKNIKRAKECISSGHGRVMEYADITMELSGVSARVMRELYTHVIGTTRTQESTRYVNCSHFSYYTPQSVLDSEEALKVYDDIMLNIMKAYDELIALGVPKEDVANILPLGMDTKVVLKINVRALEHLANMRLCNRAYKEFRDLIKLMKKEIASINEEWNWIADTLMVPNCVKMGYCQEKYCCGLMKKKEEK